MTCQLSAAFARPPFLFLSLIALAVSTLGPTLPTAGQALIFEDFTTDLQFTKVDGDGMPTGFFSDGFSSYFGTVDGIAGNFGGDPVPLGLANYDSPLFNSFLVIEDAGAAIDPLPVSLQWSNLDISGMREIDLFLDVASANASDFEAPDFLRVEFSIDGGAYVPVLEARANLAGNMAVDTDFDGVGDGSPLLNLQLAEQFEAALVNGSTLDVRLSFSVDQTGEDFAVDNFFVAEAPITDWIAPAPIPPASTPFFDPSNWSTGAVPTMTDEVAIRNGGAAIGIGTTRGDPTAVEILTLALGDSLGSGSLDFTNLAFTVDGDANVGGQRVLAAPNQGTFTGTSGRLEIRQAPSLSIGGSLEVGTVSSRGTASIESRGDVILEEITTVMIGDQLEVAGASADAFATSTAEGTLEARHIDTLSIVDDLDLCDASTVGRPGGVVTGICTAQALFQNIMQLTIGGDLEVSDAFADSNESMTASSLLEVVDVPSFLIEGDFDIAAVQSSGLFAVPATSDVSGTVRLVRTDARVIEDLLIGEVDLAPSSIAEAQVLLELVDSTLTTDPSSSSLVGVLLGGADTGTTILEAELRLLASFMNNQRTLDVGASFGGPVGGLRAEVELDDGSVLMTERLNVHDHGTLRFHLDGTSAAQTPAAFGSGPRGGSPGTYSHLSATTINLGGAVVATFDFLPPAGTTTYDLITTGSAGALDGMTASLTVEGLDGGFTVESFGVVTETVDILRLVISGTPLETDLSASLDNGLTMVLPGDAVTYSAVVSNLGPEAEVGASISVILPNTLEACSWTSVASGGASGHGSGSGSTFEEEVDLPAGSQVTYTIGCTVAASASGMSETSILVNGSRPDSAPANNAASDTDTILEPVDLAVTLDDGELAALAGELLIYELVVSNLGARDTVGSVIDIFPPELAQCSWLCFPSPGAQCTTQTVDGDLMDIASLPVGTSATYLAACVVDPALDPTTLTIVNTASVTVPGGSVDLVPANNTSQDMNSGPAALVFRDDFESGDTHEWSLVVVPEP